MKRKKRVYNTLKRKRLLKELMKKSTKNLREASIKAGFSKNSRQIYKNGTKQYIEKFLELTGTDKQTFFKSEYYFPFNFYETIKSRFLRGS